MILEPTTGYRRRDSDRPLESAPDSPLRSDGRKSWDKLFTWLRREASEGEPRAAAREILDQYRRFMAAVGDEEGELLSNPLLWNEDEAARGHWIEGAFHELSRAAASALQRFADAAANAPGDSRVAELAAVALCACTASIKWAEIAGSGRRAASMAEVHRTWKLARDLGLDESTPPVPADGGLEVALPVRAHYARALMLEAFCRGNLGRQQVVVLDAWLWAWCAAYRLSDGPAAGALLAVDAGGSRGLRALADGENLHGQVLVIEPMAEQIEHVVSEFQAGRIFPGHGLSTTFRLEVHVGLLDTLRAFLAVARKGLALRQRREGCEELVDVFVGLTEILAKAASAVNTSRSPSRPAQGAPGIDSQYEISRRTLRLVDESESGLGLEGDEGAQPLEVGTLLGLMRDDGSPVVLAEVARRVSRPGHPTRFGVRILARALHRLEISKGDGRGPTQALYLAGTDSSGRQDSVLVAQGDFDPLADYEIRFPDRVYRVNLNRVRHQGRGWLLAGVEVAGERVESAPIAPPAAKAPLTLTLAD
ncbi:MAG: hypothetical protein IPL06_17765 [Betaproteobacteria bacterium]|nr:hypothetical protein [Betaproteobacteria bacterium]